MKSSEAELSGRNSQATTSVGLRHTFGVSGGEGLSGRNEEWKYVRDAHLLRGSQVRMGVSIVLRFALL